MFTLKPDYECSKKRIDAFWNREILDRPIVQFKLYKPRDEQLELPLLRNAPGQKVYLDTEYQVDWQRIDLTNQLFLGDSLPVAYPNFSPAVMTAFYGCPLKFSENGTCWSEPLGGDIDYLEDLAFDWESPWLEKVRELTEAFLKVGKGRFITGISNWFMGGDCLAAILGSKRLGVALINDPVRIKKQLDIIEMNFERLYTEFYALINEAGQPATTWIPLVSDGKYYVIANDFSALVSTTMYREYFLNDVIRECQFLDHAIYHLDGPAALRHLDAILEVEDLDGVQFVPSPGNDGFEHWIQVYKRIQEAGKCVQVNCDLSEIIEISRYLKPEGLFLNVKNVTSEDEATALIHFLEKWPASTHHSD
jgi:hypothetical protein